MSMSHLAYPIGGTREEVISVTTVSFLYATSAA